LQKIDFDNLYTVFVTLIIYLKHKLIELFQQRYVVDI